MNNSYNGNIVRPSSQYSGITIPNINGNVSSQSVSGINNMSTQSHPPSIIPKLQNSDIKSVSAPLMPTLNANINNILQNHNILQLQQQQIQNLTNSLPLISNLSFTTNQLISKEKLQELIKEVDPNEKLDDDVEEMLMQMVEEFLNTVVSNSCLFAKHRKSNTLEVKDVQLYLEKYWNIIVPGYASSQDDMRQASKKAKPTVESHKQRMAIIKRALKKT